MWRTTLILLLAGLAACSSTEEPMEPDPFADAEPVEGGLYFEPPAEPSRISRNGFVRFLDEEWKSSVTGWSFTGRAIGRWAQRDWDRLFGDSD